MPRLRKARDRDCKFGEVESDLNVALNDVIEKHRSYPDALAMAFMSIIETLSNRIEGFEGVFEKIRAGEYGEEEIKF